MLNNRYRKTCRCRANAYVINNCPIIYLLKDVFARYIEGQIDTNQNVH